MTQLVNGQADFTYALSTIQCETREGEPLVISRPDPRQDELSKSSAISFSSIHYREDEDLPTVYVVVRGSRLVLTCLETDYESTVLEFGSAIRNVGLHDDSVNIILHVFVERLVLYSIILQPINLEDPHFEKETGWMCEHISPSFSIREPLYMHSISDTTILFSLKDGGLLRLSSNDYFEDHLFSDSSFLSSFKSILPWSGRPSNLVISMIVDKSKDILYTLSVDARLKVWNISEGRLLGIYDTFSNEKPPVFLAEPIESRYLALSEHANMTTLVTCCPQRPGLFKVFSGRSGELKEVYGFQEEQPAEGIWRVFDLAISNAEHEGHLQVHVLWKMDTLLLLQTAHVDIIHKQTTWRFAANREVFTDIPSSSMDNLEGYIFESGRFSSETLRSAMASLSGISEKPRERVRGRVLREQIVSQLHSKVKLEIDEETGNPLQDKFDEDLRLQYLNFAQVCAELDRLGSEPHSICQSPSTQETFIAQSSKITFLRRACPLERVLQEVSNADLQGRSELEVLRSAFILRDGLSADAWLAIANTLRHASLTDRTTSADDAMFLTYEKTTENRVPAATENLLSASRVSADDVTKGLRLLGRLLQQSLSDKSPNKGVLGVQTYIAEKASIHKVALDLGTILLTYLTHISCSSDEVNVYHMSSFFVTYLSIYRQNLLAFETMTKHIEPAEGTSSYLSYTTAPNSAIPAKATGSTLVIREVLGLANNHLSSRDLLDKTLIALINLEQGAVAMHFCQFVLDTPLSFYLRARSLLLNGEYTQAASLFVRIALPLVESASTKSEQLLLKKMERFDLIFFHLHVASLFSAAGQPTHAVRFCNEAELVSEGASLERKQEIQDEKFDAALEAKDWSEAYNAIISPGLPDLKGKLRQFITSLCDNGEAIMLQQLPFVGIVDDVDAALERRARNMLDVRTKPSYHKILYGFRLKHGDYRGAAAILYHRLQFLRNRTNVSGFNMADHLEITEGYLAIINALRCLAIDDAWVIIGTIEQDKQQHKRLKTQNSEHPGPEVFRKVLKLSDIRAEYNKELRNMEAQLVALQEFDD